MNIPVLIPVLYAGKILQRNAVLNAHGYWTGGWLSSPVSTYQDWLGSPGRRQKQLFFRNRVLQFPEMGLRIGYRYQYPQVGNMAGQTTIERRDTVKRGERIRYLKSLRTHDVKHKTFKATMQV